MSFREACWRPDRSILLTPSPTVAVAIFGSNVSERLSSSREELPVSNDILTSRMVLVLTHRNVGRVARTNFFEGILRVRY